MDRCAAAHDWLSSGDSANHLIVHDIYTAPVAAAIHFLCRIDTRPDLQLSNREMTQAKFKSEVHDGLVGRFMEGLVPKFRAAVTTSVVKQEVVPYSLWLLSAGEGNISMNRAVTSIDMLNADEKTAYYSHVSKLRLLGLTYVPVNQNDDDSREYKGGISFRSMRLEPEIDSVVQFKGFNEGQSVNRREIPDVVSAHNGYYLHLDVRGAT